MPYLHAGKSIFTGRGSPRGCRRQLSAAVPERQQEHGRWRYLLRAARGDGYDELGAAETNTTCRFVCRPHAKWGAGPLPPAVVQVADSGSEALQRALDDDGACFLDEVAALG